MKKIKFNYLAIGIMVAMATVAFTAKKESKSSLAITNFVYQGSTLTQSEYLDVNNWEISQGPENCSGETTPCEVSIDEPGVSDAESLVDHLASMTETQAKNLIEEKATSFKN